jgi:hypothetical protein
MPIRAFLGETPFDPKTTGAMGVAFERACQSLGLTDLTDELTQLVARRIIEAAEAGERDPAKLHEAVMLWAARVV